MKEIIINGDDFSNYNEAYLYLRNQLSENNENQTITIREITEKYLTDEIVNIVWLNSEKSKHELGYNETINFYRRKLQSSPIHEVVSLIDKIKKAERNEGETIFEQILSAISKENISICLK